MLSKTTSNKQFDTKTYQQENPLSKIDRRFCTIRHNGKDLLCIPQYGFSVNAFKEGIAQSDTSSVSFVLITGNNNRSSREYKHTVKEVTLEQVHKLLKHYDIDSTFRKRAQIILDTTKQKVPVKYW